MGDTYIPSDWNGESYCCYSVMWPNSFEWRAVLNGLIDWGGTGFYYNEQTGNVIEAITAIRATWEYNFNNEEVIMACNETGNAILERIAAALESGVNMSGCCGGIEGVNGGSSGSGMEPAIPSDVEDSEESHEGPPPTGYDSWEEFDSLKCDWANYILDQMVVDVATMGAVQVLTQSGAGLAAILIPLFVTPVGWVILLQIAIIMIAAAATSGFYGFISTHLETYRNDYLCALISGDSVANSISNFGAMVDEKIAIDGNFNALTGYWASDILRSLASVDSVNRLYQKQSFTPPSGDCSSCEPEDLFFIDLVGGLPCGSVIAGNLLTSGTLESSTIDVFGAIRQIIILTSTGEPQDNYLRIDSVISNSGATGYQLDVYDDSLSLIDNVTHGTLEEFDGYEVPSGCRQFHLFDSGDDTSSFVVEFSFSETPF